MEKLEIEGTSRTPAINFDPASGSLNLSGCSIPEDTLVFYRQIFNWLDEYVEAPPFRTVVNVDLEYFNTSTSKCLYTTFKKLEKILDGPGKVEIIWHYLLSDTDMFESGNDFRNMVNVPFQVVRKTEG